MILGLHHAQITIPKDAEEEGKQFYCNVLGLVEVEKPESLKGRGGFWLNEGSVKTNEFRAFKDDTISPPLGIQLTVFDSEFDFFGSFEMFYCKTIWRSCKVK